MMKNTGIEELDEGALWDLYKVHNDNAARQQLIKNYVPLSRKIAASLYASRFDDEIEFNDYLQYGHIGLLESINRFDPHRNIMFSTYASYRINGSILNGISKLTEKREQIATQNRLRNERVSSLADSDSDDKTNNLFEYFASTMIGMAISFMLEDTQLVRFSENKSLVTPYSVSVFDQLKAEVVTAIESLSENEKKIINSHYLEFKSFNAVAVELGITKGRVSQLHKRAIGKLRELLQANGNIDAEY